MKIKAQLTLLFTLAFSGCCIPIFGPCGQDEFFAPGATKESAAVIESQQGVGAAPYLLKIFPSTGPEIGMSGPTLTTYLPPGNYRFSAWAVWPEPPTTMGPVPVNCYGALKPGKYLLRAFRHLGSTGALTFIILIQNQSTKAVECIAAPGTSTTPVPDWVQEILNRE